MKKTRKIVLIILSVLLILCIFVCVWQRENLGAFLHALRYSHEDITTMLDDNQKLVTETLNQYPDLEIRDLNEEEQRAFEQGEITQEELVEIVMGKTSLEQVKDEKNNTPSGSAPENNVQNTAKPSKTETPKPGKEEKPATPTPAPTPSEEELKKKEDDEKVAALVAKMYVYKSIYSGKLDAIVRQAEQEFDALPKEQQTSASKQRILSKKIGAVASMEAECDAEVNAILSQLSDVLKSQGKDLSMVNSIKKSYNNEKQLRKSAYISRYLKKTEHDK